MSQSHRQFCSVCEEILPLHAAFCPLCGAQVTQAATGPTERLDHDSKDPYIAHTPTMRIPMNIAETENAYLAMWSMLLAVYRHNQTAVTPISIIACPGLGTATGRMPYAEAARQMALAWKHFHTVPAAISWNYAQVHDWEVRRRPQSDDNS